MSPLAVLQTYWHYDAFRPLQEDIVQSVLDGNDTLALLPTGGGKSICFQVPTMVMAHRAAQKGEECGEGLCLVVTPLIALMKDQVENLKKHNIHAAAIYTGMSTEQQRIALDNCQFGPYHFLYVSPERLESEEFKKRITQLPIRLIAIDEAHCISQWGYDFRPSYLHIIQIRQLLPGVPVLALTATATPSVVQDIIRQLKMNSEWKVFQQSFARKNLYYIVRYCEDTRDSNHPKSKTYQLLHILSSVRGSAIVYVRNRKRAQELSEYINATSDIVSNYYHAGLSSSERALRQQAWKQGKTPVMVCTNAFGMGIDKPDVRLVIHYDIPDSIEAYFQEAGRGGRDEKTAYAVLLYAPSDKTKARKRIADTYPEPEFIANVYHKTCDYFSIGEGSGLMHPFALHMDDLCRVMHLPILQTYSALHLLSQAGYIHFQEEQETSPRVQIKVTREDLYDYSLSRKQEELLDILMRKHSGIFTELQYISLTPHGGGNKEEQETHELLVSLAQRGIITYIPRTMACMFMLTQERQADIFLGKKVYDQRQQIYVEQLKAMVEYAEQTQFCRSQVLLSYFGEENSEPCGTCDICRSRS